ncbi:alkyl hydroperoxide reductase subunit F [Morganella morganii]|uniref:Alkyl hydroperoxide reductase subunit F n=1 Tax=Morganella morganii TaxID=582 RepID=A0A433ZZD4_MORMO|nr:alkyl hydroperoxide reductase subunit F [Morganella morganii]RUT67483.1 alkyl hydroperoxide reductase subunit F [Morganella morganii]
MLDNTMKAQLKAYLEKLTRPVELVSTLDDSAKSGEIRTLLQEIAELSPKITVREDNNAAARKPSFLIVNPGQTQGIRFAGSPLGHEFTSLVLALLQVGGHPSKEAQELLDQVRNLEGEFRFETYYSLSCHNCSDVVQALNLMTVLNPNITHTAIDGGLFQNEITERNIMGVPAVFLNGNEFGQGRLTLAEIVNKVDSNAGKRAADALNQQAPYEVLIVGSGPAGASAAVYSARKGIRTGLIGERFGGQVLDTVDIENYISVPKTEGAKLAEALKVHVEDYTADVIDNQSITALIPVAVIGGGNSGAEAAIDLAGVVKHVTLLEFAPELKADAVLQQKLRSLANVDIIVNAQTTEVLGDGSKVTGLQYKNRESGDIHTLTLAGIFVQIGLLPNTQWLKGTLDLNPMGEIVVDARNETSIKGVFGAGDCTTVPYKQIIIAAGEGAKASLSAFDYLIRTSTRTAE